MKKTKPFLKNNKFNFSKLNSLGKFGIKGNNGLGIPGLSHAAFPYDSNGKVFIKVKNKKWKRVSCEKANNKDVIKCCMCSNPAVSLDHYYPYHSELNRCVAHLKTVYEEKNHINH